MYINTIKRLFDDKIAFSMSPPTNGLPLENHSETSIASLSFDSEAGYGNKVAGNKCICIYIN